MKYEVRLMRYVAFGEWESEVIDTFDNFEEAMEFNCNCHENGLNTFVKTL